MKENELKSQETEGIESDWKVGHLMFSHMKVTQDMEMQTIRLTAC